MAHVQHEMDYGGSDAPVGPRAQQYAQSVSGQFGNSSSQIPAGVVYGQASGLTPRATNNEQSKNTIFANALSSPVRRSLQNCHPTQGQGAANGGRNTTEANSGGQLSSLQ
uniref:Uncharacterized protein n=1 Tax=Arundo donax TaxID=35708 RepID=A0A0A8Z3A1_ARUDO